MASSGSAGAAGQPGAGPERVVDPDGPPSGRAGRWVDSSIAFDAIADGSRVYICGGAAAPRAIDRAMYDQADRWSSIRLVCDRLIDPLEVFRQANQPFHLTSLQPSPAVEPIRAAGAYTPAPMPFSEFGSALAADGRCPIDVAIVHVSRPGPDGRLSLGVSVATPLAAMTAASVVIAQVNPQMPYTYGFGELTADQFDFLVETDEPLIESNQTAGRPGDEVVPTIGSKVAGLVRNGATLQVGIGAIADAVLTALVDHRDLAVHSGMISDGIINLAATGAASGVNHPRFPGRIVAGLVGGTSAAFDFVDRNPAVMMVPTRISHGLSELGRLPNFTAINSGIEVDLNGSVNGEAIGPRTVSGPGGAPDYARAASAAPDGQYIVALPATAAGGGVSRIVPKLSPQVPVTVAGEYVSSVVTEYGVAGIDSKPVDETANALRAVAAPEFRDDLRAGPS